MSTAKTAQEVANETLFRLDRLANTIQEKHAEWGMPQPVAKQMVNELDKTADALELATFGQESFAKRQVEIAKYAHQKQAKLKVGEVLQREADEPYMQTFKNPMNPIQVEADEPYMAAYRDDQSSAVHHGTSTTGRPLAP